MFDAQFDRLHATLGHVEARQKLILHGQERILVRLNNLEQTIMNSLENLRARVAESTTVMSSALSLIGGLSTQLASAIAASKAGDDHAALDALAADLSTGSTALALAISANTAAAPTATAGDSGASTTAGTAADPAASSTGSDSAGSTGAAGSPIAADSGGAAAADSGAVTGADPAV